MATLTEIRSGVMAQVASDLAIEFVPGMLVGPIERRTLGSCFAHRVTEVAHRVLEEDVLLVVRVFLRFEQVIDPETPWDPAPAEAIMDALQASVAAHQTGNGTLWQLRMVSGEIDPPVQGLEAHLVGRTLNAGLNDV